MTIENLNLKRFLKFELYALSLDIDLKVKRIKSIKSLLRETHVLKPSNSKHANYMKLRKRAKLQAMLVNETYQLTNLHIASAILRGKDPYKAYPNLKNQLSPERRESIWEQARSYATWSTAFGHLIQDPHKGLANWNKDNFLYLLDPSRTEEERNAAYLPVVPHSKFLKGDANSSTTEGA